MDRTHAKTHRFPAPKKVVDLGEERARREAQKALDGPRFRWSKVPMGIVMAVAHGLMVAREAFRMEVER